jgi:hypothetical protein
MRGTIGSHPLFGCSLFQQADWVGFRMRCNPGRQSIRLKMTKKGSIASSSFDSGATVALIGNAVGYAGPMIARPLFKAQC